VRYAWPLFGEDSVNIPAVGGLQRFARLAEIRAHEKLEP
jgi:hypothetical protein